MSQVTEQSVRFQTALASIKLIQASAVLDLTEDDFDFLTSNKVWIATDRSRARRCVRSEERFSRNAETDLVCRLLLEKKKPNLTGDWLGARDTLSSHRLTLDITLTQFYQDVHDLGNE